MKNYEWINIDKNSSEPMYLQIYNELKNLIEKEIIGPDEKLPAIRGLAKSHGVNNVTIVNAYKLLEKKGLVYSKEGSGTFVRNNQAFSMIDTDPPEVYEKSERKDSNTKQINFSTSTPNPKLFPVNEFKEVLNEVLDRDGGYAFGYQDSHGYYPLRESIRNYLNENGVKIKTEEVQVISGAQQGIDIVSKALIGFNDTIIVESPTYTGAIAAFKSRGAKIIEVGMEEDGIHIGELEAVLKNEVPKLLYIMTNFQNPTGISYSDIKKFKLLHLAEKYGFYILEDDYLSELHFYGERGIPIKSIDNNNKVIYLKSFSKIFMPGIRIAFLVAPEMIGRRILSAKHISDISTGGLMQRAMDLYLRNRKWENHIELMWNIYRERYERLIELLMEERSFVKFIKPQGGLYLWLETDVDASMLYNAALKKGVSISAGSVFYQDGRATNQFRLSLAGVELDEIDKGIHLLKEAYDNVKQMNAEELL